MASINFSINGPSIKSSHLGVVNGPLNASASATYAQWALFSVQGPLVNAFQDVGTKESVLKVQSTGYGELIGLIEDFNEGRIQFAFVKVKDPNTGLPKCVLIGWCGVGVPERTKGYYTSHMVAVSKVLNGYHVQITARSESDVAPETIIQKVADSSGAKYSAGSGCSVHAPTPPAVASRPVFTPASLSVSGRMNPIIASRARKDDNVDVDGWGTDAPPVTRTQLKTVESACKQMKVHMQELLKPDRPTSSPSLQASSSQDDQRGDIVKCGYQPIGKVDIAAIRAQAQKAEDDRPTPIKGAYEPVGKVDIAAIRAKSQPRPNSPNRQSASVGERWAGLQTHPQKEDRPVFHPKSKTANKFRVSSAFTGTKPPTPTSLGFCQPATPSTAPLGAASRTFADQAGKTPAQLWAEKKAKQTGGPVVPHPGAVLPVSPLTAQKSGSEWKSGYTGKSWATVQAPAYGRSLPGDTDKAVDPASRGYDETPESLSGGVSTLKGHSKDAQPIVAVASSRSPSPPVTEESEHHVSSGHTTGHALPGLPLRPLPEPESESRYNGDEYSQHQESPVRIAVPVTRGEGVMLEPPEKRNPLPLVPFEGITELVPEEITFAAGEVSQVSVGGARALADDATPPAAPTTPLMEDAIARKSARIVFDYERAEDNEVELVVGEIVTDIDMVDEDWWFGTNAKGERGLFPSNYVELLDNNPGSTSFSAAAMAPAEPGSEPEPQPEPQPMLQPHIHPQTVAPVPTTPIHNANATALFDYEAAEDNEIGFPDGAKITNLEFPDADWWYGTYHGKSGLFPANYVQLDS